MKIFEYLFIALSYVIVTTVPLVFALIMAWVITGCATSNPETPTDRMTDIVRGNSAAAVIQVTKERKCLVIQVNQQAVAVDCWQSWAPKINP